MLAARVAVADTRSIVAPVPRATAERAARGRAVLQERALELCRHRSVAVAAGAEPVPGPREHVLVGVSTACDDVIVVVMVTVHAAARTSLRVSACVAT
jgi:hypothetical protein